MRNLIRWDEGKKKMATQFNTTIHAAKVFVSMISLLCIYPFTQKYFVMRITLGGVKE